MDIESTGTWAGRSGSGTDQQRWRRSVFRPFVRTHSLEETVVRGSIPCYDRITPIPSTCLSVNLNSRSQFWKSLHRQTRCEQQQLCFTNIKLTNNQKRLPTQAMLFKERQNITSNSISFLLSIILDTWYSSPWQSSPLKYKSFYSFSDVCNVCKGFFVSVFICSQLG